MSEIPLSPLFAIYAERALEADNPALAIEMCERGISVYTDYSTGYVVLVKAYLALDEAEKAQQIYQQAIKRFPFEKLLAGLVSAIEEKLADTTQLEEAPPQEPEQVEQESPESSRDTSPTSQEEVPQEELQPIPQEEEPNTFTENPIDSSEPDESVLDTNSSDENNTDNVQSEATIIEGNEKDSPDEPKIRPLEPIIIQSFPKTHQWPRSSDIDLFPGLIPKPNITIASLDKEAAEEKLPDIPQLPIAAHRLETVRRKRITDRPPFSSVQPAFAPSEPVPPTSIEDFVRRVEEMERGQRTRRENFDDDQSSSPESQLPFASETIAKIYEQQGAFSAAISVYNQLVNKALNAGEFQRAEDFQARIRILTESLSTIH